MRQREDDVEVRRVQQFLLAGRQPALAGLSLAFRTVAIAAGVIRDGSVSAARAFIMCPPNAAVRQRSMALIALIC